LGIKIAQAVSYLRQPPESPSSSFNSEPMPDIDLNPDIPIWKVGEFSYEREYIDLIAWAYRAPELTNWYH